MYDWLNSSWAPLTAVLAGLVAIIIVNIIMGIRCFFDESRFTLRDEDEDDIGKKPDYDRLPKSKYVSPQTNDFQDI
uniref:DUF2897 family protein n=1 Tax=Panagrellus redivivus TaxID=6233 RepID=A0A7E4VN41_PANRE